MNASKIHSKILRDYQKRLKRQELKRSLVRRTPRLGIYGVGAFLIMAVLFYGASWLLANLEETNVPEPVNIPEPKVPAFSKKDLRELLDGVSLDLQGGENGFPVVKNGKTYTVKVAVDGPLQDYTTKLLRRSLTHQAAVIVLRPDNGQILAMADFHNGDMAQEDNLCLKADFPAASLFKIVCAAAAIEARDFTPEKTLVFRGRRYTLYKNQLKQEAGRYATKISFKSAFSKSINPVFGKIGIHDLGGELLGRYAVKFLFNLPIPFDLPMDPSNIQIPEDDFGLAEIASGFNKKTLISPLHAALMAAAVANEGTVMEPWLVRWVRDESNETVYQASPSEFSTVMKQNTAKNLKKLMAETVVNGTCRKAFRPLRRKKVFGDIKLGAKTGTINDRNDQYKVDWLSAYALPSDGKEGICVAILAIHGKKLGIRAKDIGREIINHYFSS